MEKSICLRFCNINTFLVVALDDGMFFSRLCLRIQR